jgi:hypothetical protein
MRLDAFARGSARRRDEWLSLPYRVVQFVEEHEEHPEHQNLAQPFATANYLPACPSHSPTHVKRMNANAAARSQRRTTASAFVCDLAARLKHRVQVSTDGLKCCVQAMEDGFGGEVDHGILIKVYGDEARDEARYSPPECVGCEKYVGTGEPIMSSVSTSFVERQNLTIRMRNRRLTRLTNAFSKKVENLQHSIALHFFAYNFITFHKTLKMPPAMKAGVAKEPWSYEQLVELVDRKGAL